MAGRCRSIPAVSTASSCCKSPAGFGEDRKRRRARSQQPRRLRLAIVADDPDANDLAGQLRPAHSAGRPPAVGATGRGAFGQAGGRGRVRARDRSHLQLAAERLQSQITDSSISPNVSDRSGRFRRSRRPNVREILLGALLHGQRHSAQRGDRPIRRPGRNAAAAVAAGARLPACARGRAARPCATRRGRRHGIRALQIGFRRHFGTSISEMLLDIRLAHLNASLAAAPPPSTSPTSPLSLDLPISAGWRAPIAPSSAKRRRRRCAG